LHLPTITCAGGHTIRKEKKKNFQKQVCEKHLERMSNPSPKKSSKGSQSS
jgi:hypothetical protein